MIKKTTKISKLFILFIFLVLSCQNNTHSFDNVTVINNYTVDIFADKPTISDTNKDFILKLIPLIQASNQDILEERELLQVMYSHVSRRIKIKRSKKKWLKSLEIKYRGELNETLFENDQNTILEYLSELLSRVDIVPIRLALTQAAIESGWGSSRFCIEGNAYFGIHCYSAGCGIEAQAAEDAGFEVKKYNNAQESVKDYLQFLNSKRGLQRFRDERMYYLHCDAKKADLLKLAGTLKGYSADNLSYQQMIRSILNNYIPENISDF